MRGSAPGTVAGVAGGVKSAAVANSCTAAKTAAAAIGVKRIRANSGVGAARVEKQSLDDYLRRPAPAQEREQEQHEENDETDLGDHGRSAGDDPEAEDAGQKGHNQEDNSVV